MEQYRLLAECLLPARMLDWFDLKTVRVEKKGDTIEADDEKELENFKKRK
ncbi:hypothetical protein PREVCOP_05918, partial [Segatella copri DSM 18205]